MKNPLAGEQNAHDRKQPELEKQKPISDKLYKSPLNVFRVASTGIGTVDGRGDFCNLKNHVRPLARTLSALT